MPSLGRADRPGSFYEAERPPGRGRPRAPRRAPAVRSAEAAAETVAPVVYTSSTCRASRGTGLSRGRGRRRETFRRPPTRSEAALAGRTRRARTSTSPRGDASAPELPRELARRIVAAAKSRTRVRRHVDEAVHLRTREGTSTTSSAAAAASNRIPRSFHSETRARAARSVRNRGAGAREPEPAGRAFAAARHRPGGLAALAASAERSRAAASSRRGRSAQRP